MSAPQQERAMSDRLTAIRERLEAATPGEWTCDHDTWPTVAAAQKDGAFSWAGCAEMEWQRRPVAGVFRVTESGGTTGLPGSIETTLENAQLIAHAPSDLAFLLGEVEQAQTERDSLLRDVEWRHRQHDRLGRGQTETEGRFYDRLVAERDRLRAVVEAVEWIEKWNGQWGTAWVCPWCGALRDAEPTYVHFPNCPRQAALGRGGE